MTMKRDLHEENVANTEVGALLRDAGEKLHAVLQAEWITAETPLEALSAMELAAEAIGVAVRRLETAKRPV